MLIGYARVSKAGVGQSLDLQIDALSGAYVEPEQVFSDQSFGKKMSVPVSMLD